MEKLTEILTENMGGYALYVWPSFLIAGAVMFGMAAVSFYSLKRSQNALAKLQDEA